MTSHPPKADGVEATRLPNINEALVFGYIPTPQATNEEGAEGGTKVPPELTKEERKRKRDAERRRFFILKHKRGGSTTPH